jgi:CheY-like chemotaxis protein
MAMPRASKQGSSRVADRTAYRAVVKIECRLLFSEKRLPKTDQMPAVGAVLMPNHLIACLSADTSRRSFVIIKKVLSKCGWPAAIEVGCGMYTIMLAEDHDEMRELLHDVLTLGGDWNVAAMPSGSALLKTAESVLPDMVLLDIAMPGIDGIETYQILRDREETRTVPILFVTANPGRLVGMSLQGPCETPFEIGDLVARVAALLDDIQQVQHGLHTKPYLC